MVRYLPINIIIDITTLAEVFYTKIVCYYNMPDGIISDRDSVFISAFWFAIYFYSKIKRRLSIAFYPQIDDQTERQN